MVRVIVSVMVLAPFPDLVRILVHVQVRVPVLVLVRILVPVLVVVPGQGLGEDRWNTRERSMTAFADAIS